MAYTYKEYTPSETVTNYRQQLQEQQAAKPGQYQGQFRQQLNDTMDQIMNRKPFQYDLNGDALYQQYKNQAVRDGKLAMMDTMGQAATMTGGYGNTFAQAVGQQAYNQKLSELNDRIPQLYQLALQRYDMEQNQLNQQYSMLADRDAQDYSRYRDQLGDWRTDMDYLTGRVDTEQGRDLDRYYTDRSFDQKVWSDSQERAMAQVQWYLDNGKEPPADLVELADLDARFVAQVLESKNAPAATVKKTVNTGSGKSAYSDVMKDVEASIKFNGATAVDVSSYVHKAVTDGVITQNEAQKILKYANEQLAR